MNKALCLAVMVAAMLVLLVPAPGLAVVDCSRAKSNVEKLLCSVPRLAQADQRLALAFRDAIRRGTGPKELLETQRRWIDDVRDPCNDVECMLNAYEERIAELEGR